MVADNILANSDRPLNCFKIDGKVYVFPKSLFACTLEPYVYARYFWTPRHNARFVLITYCESKVRCGQR